MKPVTNETVTQWVIFFKNRWLRHLDFHALYDAIIAAPPGYIFPRDRLFIKKIKTGDSAKQLWLVTFRVSSRSLVYTRKGLYKTCSAQWGVGVYIFGGSFLSKVPWPNSIIRIRLTRYPLPDSALPFTEGLQCGPELPCSQWLCDNASAPYGNVRRLQLGCDGPA